MSDGTYPIHLTPSKERNDPMNPSVALEILENCETIKRSIVDIVDVIEEAMKDQLDKLPDVGDDDDDDDTDEDEDDASLEEAIREHTAAITKPLKKGESEYQEDK